ncbi:hypothetical protein OROMI_004306 [Orobanche minor]
MGLSLGFGHGVSVLSSPAVRRQKSIRESGLVPDSSSGSVAHPTGLGQLSKFSSIAGLGRLMVLIHAVKLLSPVASARRVTVFWKLFEIGPDLGFKLKLNFWFGPIGTDLGSSDLGNFCEVGLVSGSAQVGLCRFRISG